MKHILRDIFIFCLDIFGISALYRIQARKKGPLVRVVVFHDVADVIWFERVIEMFSKQFTVVTPVAFQAQELSTEKINILLTFDDGYQSWITTCLPVLEKYKYKGLFFINSGLLDCSDDQRKVALFMKERLFISPKKALTWEGAQLLLQNGHTIGGHTVTHPNLAVLDQATIETEIETDKKRIEEKLGVALLHFAYPFGTKRHWNNTVFKAVIKASYTFVYTTQSAFIQKGEQRQIPRMCIEKNQSLPSLMRWIKGGYDIFNNFK